MKTFLLQIFLLILIIYICNCFSFETDGKKKEYCYTKKLLKEDKLSMSFVTISESDEFINVDIKNENGSLVFTQANLDSGSYSSKTDLNKGKYKLCFYPNSNNVFTISFQFYSIKEGTVGSEVIKNTEVRELKFDIAEVKSIFNEFETNSRLLNDRRQTHMKMLKDIINSIKRLTFFKIFIVALLSIFQIIVIRIFFGPDKRVSSLKSNKKYSNEIL